MASIRFMSGNSTFKHYLYAVTYLLLRKTTLENMVIHLMEYDVAYHDNKSDVGYLGDKAK